MYSFAIRLQLQTWHAEEGVLLLVCWYTTACAYSLLMQHCLQVSVDNIDADLFGRNVRGGSFQPSDDTLHAIKSQAIGMLAEAYEKNMVSLTAPSTAIYISSLAEPTHFECRTFCCTCDMYV